MRKGHLLVHSVNGGPTVLVDQPNTGGESVILSVPVKLNLNNGANSITFSIDQASKQLFVRDGICISILTRITDYAADLDKIVVYQQG